MTAHDILGDLSTLLFIASAAVWLIASTKQVRPRDAVQAGISIQEGRATIHGTDVNATIAVQGKWNMWAAILTGVASGAQGLAGLVG